MPNEENTPVPISKLIENIRVKNLVDDIIKRKANEANGGLKGEDILAKIAERVIEDRDADKQSMKEWEKYLEAGRKLQRQDLESKSEPWDGAANFKSPGILEACLRFGDRAVATLLKQRDLIKYDVIGPDKDGDKAKRGERITTHMNFQLNYEQKTWREDHDRVLYILPGDGALFKYTYFDSGLGANCSEVIRWPDFAVNQANTSMETCRSFTIDRTYTQSESIAKQREDIWYYYEDITFGTETQTEESKASESDEKFFIQQMFYDLDDDGYEEPYLVTVHEKTSKVMRMFARYEEENIMVKTPNGKVLSLDKVLNGADNLGMDVSGDTDKDKKNSRISQCSLVRIEPINCITDYAFIPGDLIPFEKEGTFLGLGYFHLLAGITQAINSSSNTILNAGKLASTPGGWVAKNFNKAKGIIRYKMGQFAQTLMSSQDLQNSVREFRFPEISQAFFLFNDKMRAEVERLAGSADLTDAIGANAPATTMLGMVQEQLTPLSAIILRIYRSQKKEFMKLAQLNKKFTDPEVYNELLEGEEGANYAEDYAMIGLDIMPAANPEMTSKILNLMQSKAILEEADRIQLYGGNPIPVMKKFLKDIGVEDIEEIFPTNPEQKEDPALVALQEANKIEQQLAQEQTNLFKEQIKNEKAKTVIQKHKVTAEIKETLSKVILNLEKAETEETKNKITLYTKSIGSLIDQLEYKREDLAKEAEKAAPAVSAVPSK